MFSRQQQQQKDCSLCSTAHDAAAFAGQHGRRQRGALWQGVKGGLKRGGGCAYGVAVYRAAALLCYFSGPLHYRQPSGELCGWSAGTRRGQQLLTVPLSVGRKPSVGGDEVTDDLVCKEPRSRLLQWTNTP